MWYNEDAGKKVCYREVRFLYFMEESPDRIRDGDGA